jgi:L-cysteine S-thiosulfotransferase
VSPASEAGSASRWAGALAALALTAAGPAQGAEAPPTGLPRYDVAGDAIPRPLTDRPGDPARGRTIVIDRRVGLCLLCHTGPFPEERFQGDLAPDLGGVGVRYSEGQLRLRVVDMRSLDPSTIMPSMHRTDRLVRVGGGWRDRPVLDAQQVEDVVAFLRTLGR